MGCYCVKCESWNGLLFKATGSCNFCIPALCFTLWSERNLHWTTPTRLKVNSRKKNWCYQRKSCWELPLWFSTFGDWHVEAVTPTWGKAWAWTRSMGVAVHQGNLHSNFLSWGPVVRGSHLGRGRHQGIRHPALPLGSWKVSGPAWSSVSWLEFLPPCRPPHLLSGHWWQPRWQSWCTGWWCWASSHPWC